VELEETDRLIRCGFCRVTSAITMDKFFRYTLPPKAPAGKALIYFPYWRFKGMLFSALARNIDTRFIDVSQQAFKSPHFPMNIGFRGQTQKLRFLAPEENAVYVKPKVAFGDLLSTWRAQYSAKLPKPILHQDFIGETFSMIYAPFYMENTLYDAVLNRSVSSSHPQEIEKSLVTEPRPDRPLQILATLCPHCGWDLEGDRDSLALNCNNCETVWWIKKGRLQPIKTAHVASNGENVVYLPFWRIRAEVGTIQLESYADLIRRANLPRVVQPGWEKNPFYFWSPAFKVRPQSYLTIATNVTLNQPIHSLGSGQPQGEIQGVNLPLREAVESLKLILADFLKPKERLVDWIPGLTIDPKRFLLIYLPFEKGHYELIQTEMNLAINKNLLKHAQNL
jgi:hypothetical protein